MSLVAPTTLPGGQRAWLDLEIQEFTERLHELSPNLALYREPNGAWLIAEITPRGVNYVMRSRPGAALGPHAIEKLREGNLRRRGAKNIADVVLAHNNNVHKAAKAAAEEATLEAIDTVMSKSWRGRIPSNIEDVSL